MFGGRIGHRPAAARRGRDVQPSTRPLRRTRPALTRSQDEKDAGSLRQRPMNVKPVGRRDRLARTDRNACGGAFRNAFARAGQVA
jgi:hypothetical protein